MLSGGLDPFGRYSNEFEDEGLDSACALEVEFSHWQFCHYVFVEIVYQSGHKEECGVLGHERLRQMFPPESVVHLVEDTFLAAPLVVIFHNVSVR